MKPQLADNWLEDKQKLPAWQQPKWDGVRGMHITGGFTGRSLKAFKNRVMTRFWSQPEFAWLDGELVIPGAVDDTPRLCSLTTGLCNRVNDDGIPDLIAFDLLDPVIISKGATYEDRFELLQNRVAMLQQRYGSTKIRLIENYPVTNLEQVLALDTEFLERGMEGSILRNHLALFKEGRPSSKAQELMRIKRFIDFEFVVTGLVEARENQNEAKINELGRTERSSHQENKVGKGMVGAFKGRLTADVVHNGETLFKKDMEVLVGPGQSTHEERLRWWSYQGEILGQVCKAKTLPQGVKDKLRMPIFLGLRSVEDMS